MKNEKWTSSNVNAFWGEIAPLDHLVQVYDNDSIFLDTLEGFAGTGLHDGDSVIIIGTPGHMDALDYRLRKQRFDLDRLKASDHYIPLDVDETLSKFMVNNWPDSDKFTSTITTILDRARTYDNAPRKVRAFGEMVAVLWERGMNGATVHLETLWNQLHEERDFSLYCAYPKSGFTQCPYESLNKICSTHSKVINGNFKSGTEIYYRGVHG